MAVDLFHLKEVLFRQMQFSLIFPVLFKYFILWLFIIDFLFCMSCSLPWFCLHWICCCKCGSLGNLDLTGLKYFLILFETIIMNGGLSAMIFLLCKICFFWVVSVGLYDSFLSYPDSRKLSATFFWFSEYFLLENRFDRRFSVDVGKCLIVFYGWLDSKCLYCIWSSGLL